MNEKRKDENSSFFAAFALLGQVGLAIALPIVFGALLGRFIGGVLHTSIPIATLIGLLLGLVAGVSLALRSISRLPE